MLWIATEFHLAYVVDLQAGLNWPDKLLVNPHMRWPMGIGRKCSRSEAAVLMRFEAHTNARPHPMAINLCDLSHEPIHRWACNNSHR